MNIENKRICNSCIDEEFLQQWISKSNDIKKCSFCHSNNPTVSFKELTEKVYEAIETHFHLTPSELSGQDLTMMGFAGYDWYRDGYPIIDLLTDLVGVKTCIAKGLQEELSKNYSTYDYKSMDEDPFDTDAHYDESPADQENSIYSWTLFCDEIKSKARYFSSVTETVLNDLFGNINHLHTFNHKPVITNFGKKKSFYRARVAKTQDEMEKILLSPVNELGAPPFRFARAGRMNSHGISMFYGASNIRTCVAEVRPPVGSHVIIGKFELAKKLRILDFDLLSKIIIKGSFFDPESSTNWGRVAFLRKIVDRLTKPVMPEDTDFEYLPTQVIAEFLCKKIEPRIDGILFSSSQVSGIGKNIVLFNHASFTEKYDIPPNMDTSVNFGWSSVDDFDDSISIYEEPVKDVSKKATSINKEPEDFLLLSPDTFLKEETNEVNDLFDSDVKPSLKLDIKGIKTFKIDAVKYAINERSTSRHRFQDNEKNLY